MTTAFNLYGTLPGGTTVLEASAGTGKTFAIAALATRYVAETGVSIEQLMVVTFGRAATAELRERVRARMSSAVVGMRLAQGAPSATDDLVNHLLACDGTELDLRLHRLERALSDFDAAMISTTHGFAMQMLAGLGIAADVDPSASFEEDTRQLAHQVVTDLYLARVTSGDEIPADFTFELASKIGSAAIRDRHAVVWPAVRSDGLGAGFRANFAVDVRDEMARRMRSTRIRDFDDMLTDLRDAVVDEITGEQACQRVRSRFAVVLVDEFQDTDPVQWEILQRVFHGHSALVLIGDPKQAIYAFRGGDIVTYLAAVDAATQIHSLDTNWRSDAQLLEALSLIMGGTALGDPGIVVGPVRAHHQNRRLRHAPHEAPLRIRRVAGESGIDEDKKGQLGTPASHNVIERDMVNDIVRLLGSAATMDGPKDERPVRPSDIAVLVQKNSDAQSTHAALRTAGVPAILTGTSSLFASEAAREWLALLSAMAQPQRLGLIKSAALTAFIGWSAIEVAEADEAALDDLATRLRDWSDVLVSEGLVAVIEDVAGRGGLMGRALEVIGGERLLTDLRHLGENLHSAYIDGAGTAVALRDWLANQIAESVGDSADERSRRLDTQDDAVTVVTVHRSKGLEYPIVYLPYLWDRNVRTYSDELHLHDSAGVRMLDVGGKQSPEFTLHSARAATELSGESLRLAYVALTRAKSQVVTWWAPSRNTPKSALHRLVFGTRELDGMLPESVKVPGPDEVTARLSALAETARGIISVESVPDEDSDMWQQVVDIAPEISVRTLTRAIDLTWSRTSFTGLSSGTHAQQRPTAVTEALEETLKTDEPVVDDIGVRYHVPADLLLPMADLPRGAAFGTLVHEIFERTSFDTQDLESHLTEICSALDTQRQVGVSAGEMARRLVPSIMSPLGTVGGGIRLRDVGRFDRLDEMSFELPLAGGDRPTGSATLSQIADLLRTHLSATDPLVAYADDLDVIGARTLRGFLTGSIDLVLRVRDSAGIPRYVVADYKTNWLGSDGVISSDLYSPRALADAMRASHYPLQSLLYSVALHRYLRWRQPKYDPQLHLGGVLYLFLRGMRPSAKPNPDTPSGVFAWSPPSELIVQTSDLLDRGL